jgi:hypothetical protein
MYCSLFKNLERSTGLSFFSKKKKHLDNSVKKLGELGNSLTWAWPDQDFLLLKIKYSQYMLILVYFFKKKLGPCILILIVFSNLLVIFYVESSFKTIYLFSWLTLVIKNNPFVFFLKRGLEK